MYAMCEQIAMVSHRGPSVAEIRAHRYLSPDGDHLYGWKFGVCLGEAVLKRGVTELVYGTCLPQHLPPVGFIEEVQETYPAAPRAGEH